LLEISPKLNSALGQRGGIFEFKYLGEFKVELENSFRVWNKHLGGVF
jgi:hypothetical protein